MDNAEFTQIEIEEFKYIADRKKEFENRSDKRLLFCISAFGVIIGFSGKIEAYFIPYLLAIILLPTVHFVTAARLIRIFTAAYVARKFYRNSNIAYESLYMAWASNQIQTNKIDRFFPYGNLGTPIALLFAISAFSSYYFGQKVVGQSTSITIILIYFSGLALLHLYILLMVLNSKKYTAHSFNDFMDSHFSNDGDPQL